MRLNAIIVQKYRNIVNAQRISVERDVTCLVGKNESGKTTILKALHRLKPANGTDRKFDLTTEYPRWRLARDRKADANLADTRPITAEFVLEDADIQALTELFGTTIPSNTVCCAARDYNNGYYVWLECKLEPLIRSVASESSVDQQDLDKLVAADSITTAQSQAKELAKELKEADQALRAKAVTGFATAIGKLTFLSDPSELEDDQLAAVEQRIPSFFYFSSYNILPGECDLTDLAEKVAQGTNLGDGERTVLALLAHAGEEPADFLDADYNSRKAELQAASVDLSRQVFEYWRQNDDLDVVFDTDNVVAQRVPSGNELAHAFSRLSCATPGTVTSRPTSRPDRPASSGSSPSSPPSASISTARSRSSSCWTSRAPACTETRSATSCASSSMS